MKSFCSCLISRSREVQNDLKQNMGFLDGLYFSPIFSQFVFCLDEKTAMPCLHGQWSDQENKMFRGWFSEVFVALS